MSHLLIFLLKNSANDIEHSEFCFCFVFPNVKKISFAYMLSIDRRMSLCMCVCVFVCVREREMSKCGIAEETNLASLNIPHIKVWVWAQEGNNQCSNLKRDWSRDRILDDHHCGRALYNFCKILFSINLEIWLQAQTVPLFILFITWRKSKLFA